MAPSWASRQGTLHVVSFEKRDKRKTNSFESHVWSGPLPEGSFYDLGHGLYVSSPAFEFLFMAAKLDIRELVAFGYEICGLYAFDPDAERGFKTRSHPLVTKRQLARYLANASNCRGHRKAVRALRFIVERSASPMESTCVMLSCLPYSLGGYSLPAPLMNHRVQLSAAAQTIAKRKYCIADACYPKEKLDLEYHGRYDHDASAAFDSDRSRVNALIEMGYEVIELTSSQVRDLNQFEAIMRHVAKLLGKRIRSEGLGRTPARLEARKLLFDWNQRSGEPAAQ